jgi:hypothetical protein
VPATIVSGGLIRETRGARVALAPLPYTETWTVSDHADLNGDKSWTMGASGWTVASQTAQLTNNGFAASRGQCNVDCGTDNYAATITLITYSTDIVGALSAGPCVRMQGDASLNFYAGALVASGGGSPTANLFKFVGGVQTQLGSPSAPLLFHVGMTLTVRAVGSSIRLLVDGAPMISVTDTALPTGRFAGIQGVATGGNFVRLDNLAVSAATGGITRVPLELLSLTPYAGVR